MSFMLTLVPIPLPSGERPSNSAFLSSEKERMSSFVINKIFKVGCVYVILVSFLESFGIFTVYVGRGYSLAYVFVSVVIGGVGRDRKGYSSVTVKTAYGNI